MNFENLKNQWEAKLQEFNLPREEEIDEIEHVPVISQRVEKTPEEVLAENRGEIPHFELLMQRFEELPRSMRENILKDLKYRKELGWNKKQALEKFNALIKSSEDLLNLEDEERVPEVDIMPSIQKELDLETDMISNNIASIISRIEKSLEEDTDRRKKETIH